MKGTTTSPGSITRPIATILWSIGLSLLTPLVGLAVFFALAAFLPMAWTFISAALVASIGTLIWGGRKLARRGPKQKLLAFATLAVCFAGQATLVTIWSSLAPKPAAPAAAPQLTMAKLPTGSHLAYRIFEPKRASGAAPIIFLHGGPGIPPRLGTFDFYGSLTQSGRRVIVYEQAGTGRSANLADVRDYRLDRHIADLDALRGFVDADRVVLIGQSWGAVLATHYLARHPDRVERLALISPGAFRNRDRFQHDYRKSASIDSPGALVPPPRLVMAGMLARINPDAALSFASQKDLGAIYDAFAADPNVAYGSICRGSRPNADVLKRGTGGNFYVNLMTLKSLAAAADPSSALKKFQGPTIILRGACDYIDPAVSQDYASSPLHTKVVEIAGAGHLVTATHPQQVRAVLLQFLAQQTDQKQVQYYE